MRLHLANRDIYVYVFPSSDPIKIQTLSSFWLQFDLLCEYCPLYRMEDCDRLPPSSVILFVVTSLADLDVLIQLKLPQSIVKIVAYCLTWIIHEESRKGKKESLKRNRIKLSNN